jgi:integrase/recombinase XerC
MLCHDFLRKPGVLCNPLCMTTQSSDLLVAQAIGGRTGYLFPGKIDGHISADRVGHLLAAVLGDGWSAHTLRHRFATQAYACAHDLFAVQRLLGHSQPQTTLRYTQLQDDSLRAAIRGLDEWAA